ncbi:hypothetical protein OPU71_02960 [Niveibacterium sp. 24ML]|uniref:DUF6701 domain-containing protein n=1 Tax=Niveibacterium sp. 24ML TaxID=2985512 RepID=UPI0022708D5D|nr:DUF6701 domain-containing protein [Niveibacterium sp. 24ML]MCX9155079.1 hypothetical protein [Niveibacterium sp. 24ML]
MRVIGLRCLCGFVLMCCTAVALAAISVTPGATATTSGNSTLTLVTPTGTASGDVLVALIAARAPMSSAPPSAAWSKEAEIVDAAGGTSTAVYTLVLTAAPAVGYGFTLAGGASNATSVGGLLALRGVNTAVPVCAFKKISAASGSTLTAPAVGATCAAGGVQVNFFSATHGNATISPASGSIGLQRGGGGADGAAIAASWRTLTATGDSRAVTASSTLSAGWGAISMVFQTTAMTCFSDDFNRAALGSDWVAIKTNGSFTPTTVTSPSPARARLTDNIGNESTAMTLQRLIPAANGIVQVTLKFFAYGQTNPADGVSVILSDATITPQAGGRGGALGYVKFAGGWLGVGLDEYGNFSNTAGGQLGGPGRVPQSVAIRGSGAGVASTGYRWITGTGTLTPTLSTNTTSTTPSPGHLYRVTIDSRTSGKSFVTVERDTTSTGNAYSTLLGPIDVMTSSGQVAVPSNLLLSLAGSTGGSMAFHEITGLKVCANAINPVSAQIDHIRFLYAQQALTCTPSDITVQACMDAACTTTYEDNVTVTLTPTGWLGGDTKVIAGSGTPLKLAKTVAGTYTLGVSATSVPLKPYSAPQCWDGATKTDCSIVFNAAGLSFSVPNLVSGQTSAPITVSAVRQTAPNTACVPAFANVTRNVGFWSSYSNPATGTMNLAVNGSNVGTTAGAATSLALAFNGSGQATINVQYPDAGQIRLDALYTGNAANSDSGLSMPGNSQFVVKPVGLCVESPDANWNCASLSAGCTKYVQAGQPFNLRVSGRKWVNGSTDLCSNPVTPNYQQAGIALSSAVLAPAGGSNGTLGVGSISPAAGDGGSKTINNQTLSDVGVFRITATPATAAYFGETVAGGAGVTGRIYPAGFKASGVVLNNRSTAGCAPASSFSYLGEPFATAFTLQAVSAATGNPAVQNYLGSFAKLSLASAANLGFGVQHGAVSLNSRLTASCAGAAGSCGTWAAAGVPINASLTVARAASPDGPYTAALVGMSPVDSDGVRMLPQNFSSVPGGATDGAQLASTHLRYGRVRVSNAYGTALQSLAVPSIVESYTGTAFAKNTLDSCTLLPIPASTLVGSVATPTAAALYCAGGLGFYPLAPPRNQLAPGSTTLTALASAAAGDIGVKLGKPNLAGYVDLALAVPDWLKFNWDGVKNASGCTVPGADLNDDNPRARIRFGAFRNPSIIFMGESY